MPKLVSDGNWNIHFNFKHVTFWEYYVHQGGFFYYMVTSSWFLVYGVFLVYYLLINLFFGALYYAHSPMIGNSLNGTAGFSSCFYFAFQTMNTIGYGYLYPNPADPYVNILVIIQSWFGIITYSSFGALIYTKFSRPCKLDHVIKFSENMVLNRRELVYEDRSEDENNGVMCLAFRMVNARHHITVDNNLSLWLKSLSPGPYGDGEDMWKIHEINYEIHHQASRRVHETMCANPVIPLPWVVVHPITPDSPLYGKTLKEAADMHCELIAVFNGIDEYSSFSLQPVNSWKMKDIRVGMRYETIVSYIRNEFAPVGTTMYNAFSLFRKHSFNIDLSRLSNVIPVPGDNVMIPLGSNLRLGVDFREDTSFKTYAEAMRERAAGQIETDPCDPVGKIQNVKLKLGEQGSSSIGSATASKLRVVEHAFPKRLSLDTPRII